MGKINDLTGQRFGRITVVSFAGQNNHRAAMWNCVCDCGASICVKGASLVSGHTVSCGCRRREALKYTREKRMSEADGHSSTKLFYVWQKMLRRCETPTDKCYQYYGGRGITVCREWHNWAQFKAWAVSAGYQEGLTIDRIDNGKGYCAENCRWVSMRTQNANKRNNIKLTLSDETHTIAEWAEILALPASVLYARRRLGWTTEEILTVEPYSGNRIHKTE